MNKSILFVNQSSGYLMIDIINAHVPYYDRIVLFTGFLNPRETPLHPKVKVVKGLKYKRTSSMQRKLTWLGFWLQSLFYVFLKYRNHTLYFVSNPPLNIFTAKLTKRNFAFLVYDIYPEALSKYNFLNENSYFFKYWQSTNQKVYNKAISVFTISEGMKNAMNYHGNYDDKIDIVPVWTNNNFFKDIPASNNKFLSINNIKDKFIVSYSGNLGKSHPTEKIIDIAQNLKFENDIVFLIIGNGDKKNILLNKQKQLSLPNLKILDYQPIALFPHVLAATNIGIITSDQKAGDLNVPSKTFNLMSAGKPILSIANASSELAKIVTENEIGKNFDEQQIKEMSNFILKLKNNKYLYEMLKKQSQKTSLKYHPDNAKKMILR